MAKGALKRIARTLFSTKERVITSDNWDSRIGGKNRILGPRPKKSENVTVVFHGRNNVLAFGGSIGNISDTRIEFHGDNALLYLESSDKIYSFSAELGTNSIVFFGRNIFFNVI